MKNKRNALLLCLTASLGLVGCVNNSSSQTSVSSDGSSLSSAGSSLTSEASSQSSQTSSQSSEASSLSSSENSSSSSPSSECSVSSSSSSSSEINGGAYYSSIDWSQRGATLKTSLSNLIFTHKDIGYSGLYNAYKTTDVRPNGKIWDMYSAIEYTPGTDENHSSYVNEGDNYNREHTIPQSVFKSATPMYSDLFHIYPTDSKVNGIRSDYPHGEITGSPSYTSSNGCKLGMSDPSTGYSERVFEVIDEYKGDFARTYFYFVTAYQSKMTAFTFPSLASNTFPSLSTWAQSLYLKWAKEDPVSEKEIKRNESVFSIQHNRNPFIDNPEAAERIWGNL